jgi:hypothetical protein
MYIHRHTKLKGMKTWNGSRITTLTLAWMGGFFDGEGCLGQYYQKQYWKGQVNGGGFRLCLYIVNTQRELLEPFLVFGGHINVRRTTTKKWSQAYVYQLRDKRVIRFLQLIQPFIKSKRRREQITEILSKQMQETNKYSLVLS